MAVSLVNNLFPPQVETFQPAFIYNENATVQFTISPFNAAKQIHYIHVSVTDQRNNENVLLGSRLQSSDENIKKAFFENGWGLVNGLLVIEFPQSGWSSHDAEGINYYYGDLLSWNKTTDVYTITIPVDALKRKDMVYKTWSITEEGEAQTTKSKYFNVGQYYKIQLRLDSNFSSGDTGYNLLEISNLLINNSPVGVTKLENYMVEMRPYFSEWSEVTLIKPIFHVNVSFPKLDSSTPDNLMALNQGINRIAGKIELQDKILNLLKTTSSSFSSNIDIDEVQKDIEKANIADSTIDNTEHLEKYQLQVYPINDKYELIITEKPLAETGWVYAEPVEVESKYTSYGINTVLDLEKVEGGEKYGLLISLYTNNNYFYQTERIFVISELYKNFKEPRWNNRTDDPAWADAPKRIEVNQEDGIAKIKFRWSDVNLVPGYLYIKRSCSKDNYKDWKIICVHEFMASDLIDGTFSLDIEDSTIGSLYQYRYSAQFQMLIAPQNADGKVLAGAWTEIYNSGIVYAKFYDMLLQRQGRQIAIRYNGQISNWKPVVNRQKVDTLGGKYPKFVENAQMNYRQFNISGLISAEGDYNRTFLNEFEGKWELKDDKTTYEFKHKYQDDIQKYDQNFNSSYLVRNDTAPDGNHGDNIDQKFDPLGNRHNYHNYLTLDDKGEYKYAGLIVPDTAVSKAHGYDKSIFAGDVSVDSTDNGYLQYYQHDLYPHDNWYWERVFREELIAWLNDGEPKLYRSMPEGNLVVMLTDLSLTPNAQLGRRLYNFSATLYEIGDGYSLDTLDALGIYNVPKLSSVYGNVISSDIASDSITEDESEDLFTKTERRVGQMYLPRIYGRDLIVGAADGSSEEIEAYQIIWDQMTLQTRLNCEYMGALKHFKLKNNPILEQVKIQYVKDIESNPPSVPRYYVNNEGQNAANWVLVKDDESVDKHAKDERGNDTGNVFQLKTNPSRWWSKNITVGKSAQNLEEASLMLGYKLMLKANNTSYKEILVNDRGFYQVPSETEIAGIKLENDNRDQVIIDYIMSYKYNIDTSNIPLRILRHEVVMGQWGDIFSYGYLTSEKINQKYFYTKYQQPSTYGKYKWIYEVSGEPSPHEDGSPLTDIDWINYIRTKLREGNIDKELPISFIQMLEYWNGISLDVSPYSVVQVTHENENKNTFVVGRTGVLSFIDDVPTREVKFCGRRMVQVSRNRQPYLDEWEYVLSEDLLADFDDGELQIPINWIDWYNNQEEETQIEVIGYFGISVEEADADQVVSNEAARHLYAYWLNLANSNIKRIVNPQYNTIYQINYNNKVYYYIYYIDDKWYEIFTHYEDEDGDVIADMKEGTIVAKVPVYGYLNYTGSVLRSWYE